MFIANPISLGVKQDWITPWFMTCVVLAFLPFFHFLLTLDWDGKLSAQAFAARHYSLPVIVGEIAIIFFATRERLSIFDQPLFETRAIRFLLLAWLMVAAAATLSTTDQMLISTITTLRYALHLFFFAAVLAILTNAKNFDTQTWFKWITIGGGIYVLSIFIFALLVPYPEQFPWMFRLPSGTNVRQIGNVVAILSIAPFAMIMANAPKRLAYMLALAVMTMFVAWTGTRGAILGFCVGAFLTVVVLHKRYQLVSIFLVISAYVAGFLASIALPKPAPDFGILRMSKTLSPTGEFDSGRTVLWRDSLIEIEKAPWLGHGAGRFNNNMRELYGYDLNHPHQLVLQYCYDWGIVGGLIGLLLVAFIGIVILRKASMDRLSGTAALASYVTVIAIAQIEGTMFHPLPITLLVALTAPLLYRQTSRCSSNNNLRVR